MVQAEVGSIEESYKNDKFVVFWSICVALLFSLKKVISRFLIISG